MTKNVFGFHIYGEVKCTNEPVNNVHCRYGEELQRSYWRQCFFSQRMDRCLPYLRRLLRRIPG